MKKILIAEDEKPMARAMELKLSKEGMDVTVAHNGREAIDFLSKQDFDLVLCDLIMPVKDGFSVLEFLQQSGKKTPVIVASNLSQEEDVRRSRSLGAVDYFVKSDTPIGEIVEKVKKYL